MTIGPTLTCPLCGRDTHALVDGRLCWECTFPRPHLFEEQAKIAAEFQAIYAELGMTR